MDSTGKSIAGAQVTMTETDKGVTRGTVSDGQGSYTFPNLAIGPYRLEVKAPVFKDYVQTGIVLQVNNNIQINVPMQVGSAVSERVEARLRPRRIWWRPRKTPSQW